MGLRPGWKVIRIAVPPELYRAYCNDAASVGNNVASWGRDALASYHGHWKTPDQQRVKKGGKSTKGAGLWCVRCDVKATECRKPELHEQWGEWEEE